MTDQTPPIRSRFRRFQYAVLFLVVLSLVGGSSALLISKLASVQNFNTRRVAYAATATFMAHPPPTADHLASITTSEPSLLPTTPPPASSMFPTTEDFRILPTSTVVYTAPPGAPPPATPFPYPAEYQLVNFLVLGSDRLSPTEAYRTDVILVASANLTTNTVSLLSIPRDLYVYIPGWGMDRINTAEFHERQTHQASHPLGLLAETIEYNLGVRIDHIARIDFDNFVSVVDLLGGVTVPVDCPLDGYQPENGNWVPFVLEPGMHHMDGSMALWYVRQRMTTSDFDRNRRQQIVLRALWNVFKQHNLMQDFPALWEQFSTAVETDIALNDALSFVPLLLNLDSSRIESHFLGLDEVNLWRSPTGASVLVTDTAPLETTLHRFFSPPIQNQLVMESAHVEVVNASSNPEADQLAAARLQWYGLQAVALGPAANPQPNTRIFDYTGRVKGSSLGTLQTALRVMDSNVALTTPSDGQQTDFTVVIGEDFQSCATDPWRAFPQPE